MRESVPAPMERITACRAEVASMSRNCRVDVSGGPTDVHEAPPSVVRSTVPSVPLTHATLWLTADSPRNRALLPVGDSCHATSAGVIRLVPGPASREDDAAVETAATA